MPTSEVKRFLQKCQKERDEALRREASSSDKLKTLQTTTRTRIQELKQQLKETTQENKVLAATVKRLRIELGLEISPRFKGKMTRDIIRELRDREEQCVRLGEQNDLFSLKQKETGLLLAQTQKLSKELAEQLQAAESKVEELSTENTRLSKLLQETEEQREELALANLLLRKSLEEPKQLASRSVQTTTSIPVTFQSTYLRRNVRGSQYPRLQPVERKPTSDKLASPSVHLENPQSGNSSQKSSAKLY
ncbi:uncharacterized protein LOC115100199 [Rhinatrema bivittatum]|uniref:uncharacterized protein LOC115100199 n=1 Tax=Rhinatrema bivittatum TaxID=194408 RepID=UPI001127955A|nr:uncharacterized protein LOC115100199 [Rhinatrema bivittatum]